jgi:CRISPR-associated protein Cas2
MDTQIAIQSSQTRNEPSNLLLTSPQAKPTALLVCYDIETTTNEGERRLNKVRKICRKYGQRVQDSVFEFCITTKSFQKFVKEIHKIINPETDSIRIYRLFGQRSHYFQQIGQDHSYDPTGLLLFGDDSEN